ncbi:alpha/beta hydrolase [Bradyrhizobium sp. WSM1743]|uniref:alpha/beta hydrolase n=1 Tax=Bradyrhizobium sp. WSM1743 TaxID=318996 RepID=UPI0004282884|nr:alpha/beta hydrolase [Bradyrhizobium sp. WSM1743]
MEGDNWPHGSRDGAGRNLSRLRNRASEFFESLSVAELARETHRQRWVADWLRIADDYRLSATSAREEDGPARGEAGLCSLTALEVARSLSCPEDPAFADLAGKVGANLKGLVDGAGPVIERVEIDGFDQGSLTGFFVPASRRGPRAPAVICIGDEGIMLDSMVSRLLPATRGGTASLLFVGAGASTVRRRVKPEHMFQCWLDYLEAREDVDPQQIAVYGEGTGASYASRLAVSDRRIAAAVCDAGLLTSVTRRASVHWMTGLDETASTVSLQPSHRIACPLLMVVGSRSMLREQEALELQASYRRVGADCSVVVPNRVPHPLGGVENFIAVDDFIVQWLDGKLGAVRQFDPVTYL